MMRNPMTDWMLPPDEGESGEFERRWNVAPDRQKTLSDVFQQAGMPYMERYREPLPHETRRRDERLAAEQRLANAPDVLPRAGPDWLYKETPDPFGGRFKASPRVQQDIESIGALGASFVVPQSAWDIPGAVLLPLKGVSAATKVMGLAAPHVLEPDEAEAAGLTPRQAMKLRKARAQRMGGVADQSTYNELPLPPRTHNEPPAGMRIADEVPPEAIASPSAAMALDVPPMTPAQANAAWLQGMPRPSPAATSTAIPDIRNIPVADAIAIARTQPHLIKAGEGSPGMYVGGPEGIQSKAALNAQRRRFDAMVASDPRGGDWYDRYRAGQNLTTGGNPEQNLWQSAQHGQFSAGVSPEHELNLALKENNASIAGMPYKAGTPAQHEAHLRAIAAKDPMQYQLGEKTYQYMVKTNADQPGVPAGGTATGVNDFRQGNVHGYPEAYDKAFTPAQHKYLDYETALAVDRANQSMLGGRNDWTGEKLQAIPWVIDKAHALMSRNSELTYEQAMQLALKTVVDYYPKHTYFATHEAQPGANVAGHMAGSVNAPQSVRDQFALDPQSSWANAPMGRDAIYAGLGVEGTGNYMRVLPSVPMQGVYDTPAGNTEFNLGFVARPLGAFQSPRKYPKEFIGPRAPSDEPFKRTAAAEETILNAGEALRGYIDAQNVSTWHKHWAGGPNKESGSLFIPRDAPASQAEIIALRKVASQYGLGDVVDTGRGLTVTSFGGAPDTKLLDQALKAGAFKPFGEPLRTRLDSGYIDYVGKWDEAGSGQATRHMLDYISKTPELRDAFNRNELVAKNALDRMERDEKWASRWGAPREDIQRAREIISQGPGWVDRLEAALKAGVLLPATVAAIFAGATAVPREVSNDKS